VSAAVGALAGAACGVLSGWGIGGGSLLLIYMSFAARMEQGAAQGINLIYFIPTSATSLVFHFKNGLVDRRCALLAALAGAPLAAAAAFAATALHPDALRRIFGAYLIWSALRLLGKKNK